MTGYKYLHLFDDGDFLMDLHVQEYGFAVIIFTFNC